MNTHLGLNRSPWLTRHELPCIPSPTTLRALLSLLCCPPSAADFRRPASPVWTSPLMRRLAATYGRNVFALLRTASSPRVALHPASRRRSYLRLSGVGISRERTCTSQIAPAPRRTHSGAGRNPVLLKLLGYFDSSDWTPAFEAESQTQDLLYFPPLLKGGRGDFESPG